MYTAAVTACAYSIWCEVSLILALDVRDVGFKERWKINITVVRVNTFRDGKR